MRLGWFDMLPDRAFERRPGSNRPATLEGGKGGGPAPDPNIGRAQQEMADLAKEQWTEFKTNIYPTLIAQQQRQEERLEKQYLKDTEVADFNLEQARKATQRYEEGAIPAMEKLRADAEKYNEDAYREQLAQQATADVRSQFANQRQMEQMRMQRYGIDPTSGVAMGNNQALGVQEALAGAQSANQVRQAARDLGIAKLGNVYNMYAGLPSQALQSTGMGLNAMAQGQQAGQAAVGNASNTASVWNAGAQTGMQGWSSLGNMSVAKYNADINKYNAEASNDPMKTVLGAAAGVGTAYGMKRAFT